MKKIIRLILLLCALLVLAAVAVGCAKDPCPYGRYNKDGYTVSVKFDANGGIFATNTSTRVDTYDASAYTANAEGKKEIQIFDPNDTLRNDQKYAAYLDEYHFLAGWYTERTEVSDGNGGTKYEYSGWWDFKNDRLEIDADAEYDANEPVVTLYAAWVPKMTYEFYTVDKDGKAEQVGEPLVVDPTKDEGIKLPSLNTATGKIGDENGFPKLSDKTYDKIYKDSKLTLEITGDVLKHSGTFDQETATMTDPVMKVYCTTIDGLWFEVDTPEKITKNAFLNAHFVLRSDIDFTGKFWPTVFQSGNFAGSIEGNGYKIKNITVTQNNVNPANFGLFGQITENASFKDVTFEGITMKVTTGLRPNGANLGILAGIISDKAELSGVVLKNSTLEITADPNKLFVVNPQYGIVSGYGSLEGITYSENNKVTFDGESPYETPAPDEEGRFTLTKKTS